MDAEEIVTTIGKELLRLEETLIKICEKLQHHGIYMNDELSTIKKLYLGEEIDEN